MPLNVSPGWTCTARSPTDTAGAAGWLAAGITTVDPARMSSGSGRWLTAASSGYAAASPSSRCAMPLNVSPGCTSTDTPEPVEGEVEGEGSGVEGSVVRASAGSRSTHPGRGKVVAVSAPPSAWVRRCSGRRSPMPFPRCPAFSPRSTTACPRLARCRPEAAARSGVSPRRARPRRCDGEPGRPPGPRRGALSDAAAMLIGAAGSGGRACAAVMVEVTVPVMIMNSSTDAVRCAQPRPRIRGRERPVSAAGISSTMAAAMITQAMVPMRTSAPMNNRPVSGPSNASHISPRDGTWSGSRSFPTVHSISGAPSSSSPNPTSPTIRVTRRLTVVILRPGRGRDQLDRCRAPSCGRC